MNNPSVSRPDNHLQRAARILDQAHQNAEHALGDWSTFIHRWGDKQQELLSMRSNLRRLEESAELQKATVLRLDPSYNSAKNEEFRKLAATEALARNTEYETIYMEIDELKDRITEAQALSVFHEKKAELARHSLILHRSAIEAASRILGQKEDNPFG